MKQDHKRELCDYQALMDSLDVMEAQEAGSLPKNDSLTSRVVAADFARVLYRRSHSSVLDNKSWPVMADELTFEHPLLHPLRSGPKRYRAMISKNKHLRSTLKALIGRKMDSIDVGQVLPGQIALMLEEVVERVVKVRQALDANPKRPSSWETIIDILPLVCEDARIMERVHKRLFSLFDKEINC